MVTKKRTNLAELSYSQFFTEVAELLEQARKYSARSVNAIMTHTYWEVGRRIVEHEQHGKKRAVYGEALIERLALDLTRKFGRGFSQSNLWQMRDFYLAWPILQTASGESRPSKEIKDPMVLEFLGLKDEYSESALEDALIHRLEQFLLELGNDFSLIARQKRLRVGDEWYRVDLLFFSPPFAMSCNHRPKNRQVCACRCWTNESLPQTTRVSIGPCLVKIRRLF
jgi:predicted nuclease of restriction endonuclease-like (RecB) superfamily